MQAPSIAMNRRAPRIVDRIYEHNIVHNPRTWMGIWTPHGWRIHRKRWGAAERLSVTLVGDGRTTFFPEALLDPETRRVEWQDDLHLQDDPFTDRGIYPCDPRVEYPVGQPRWAVSHTLYCYPVADHNLYTHEYTWDMVHGHLQTYFRRHVVLEEARTDARDGMTVEVRHKPISTTIEGNVHYPLPNSAVRGVWADAQKHGENLYTRRAVQCFGMHNSVYGIPPRTPVVQCHGLWPVLPTDPISEVFDDETGDCRDRARLIEAFKIALDEPKAAMLLPQYRQAPSKVYEGTVTLFSHAEATLDAEQVRRLRERLGARFHPGRVGYAQDPDARKGGAAAYQGYDASFDINGDGIIDERDEMLLARHIGRTVRCNLYLNAYFGGDWLSVGSSMLHPEHDPGIPVIADYEYGGGYDAQAGVIRLLRTPGPDRPVWVEYHHDAPAEAGQPIRVHLYRERNEPHQG